MVPRNKKKPAKSDSPVSSRPPSSDGFTESEDIIRAIRAGEVDAFVIHTGEHEHVLTLDRAQKSYLSLLERVREGALTLTPAGMISYAGARIASMLRLDAQQLLGQSFLPYVRSDQHARFNAFLAKAIEDEDNGEFELITHDQSRSLPVILRGHRFEFDNETRAVGVIVQDLSDERILEKLRQSEERYRYAALAANDVIWEWVIADGSMQINTALQKSFGWEIQNTDIAWWNERINPDDRPRIVEGLQHAIEDGEERWEAAFHFQRANGTYAYAFNRAFIVRDENNTAIKVIGALLDLSERYKYEQALRNAEERLRLAMEAGEIGTWKLDFRKQTAFRDAKLNAILGLDTMDAHFPLMDFLSSVHPQDRETVRERFLQAVDSGELYDSEHRIVMPAGQIRWLRERGQIFRSVDGPLYATGATIDITDQKTAEEALKELNQKLEQRVEEKTRAIHARSLQLRHLANEQTKIVHRERKKIAELMHNDIQQILVSVLMCMKVVGRDIQDRHILKTLDTSRDLLKDAIDKTRLMTIELHPPIFQHGSLVEALNWIVSEKKKKYNLSVHLEMEDGLERPSDEIKYALFDCVREILFNVVKHSGVSEARLTLGRRGNLLTFCVSDRGKGCEPFDFETRNAEQAAHFGLFSIKERIENYEGTLEIRTVPGQGFSVLVSLPYQVETSSTEASDWACVEDEPEPYAAKHDHHAIRVLVVDDHQLFREGIINILQSESNMDIAGQAANGQEAVELARSLRPDLILMDINLPIMNGIQATSIISEKLPGTRIVALSMNRDESTIRSIREAGALAYVEKGSCAEDLIRTINQVMSEHPRQKTA